MVFSAKSFSFLTELTGFSGFSFCFFPFPDERGKSFAGGSGIRGFLRRPKMVLWPVQGYLSNSLRSFTRLALNGFRWI